MGGRAVGEGGAGAAVGVVCLSHCVLVCFCARGDLRWVNVKRVGGEG